MGRRFKCGCVNSTHCLNVLLCIVTGIRKQQGFWKCVSRDVLIIFMPALKCYWAVMFVLFLITVFLHIYSWHATMKYKPVFQERWEAVVTNKEHNSLQIISSLYLNERIENNTSDVDTEKNYHILKSISFLNLIPATRQDGNKGWKCLCCIQKCNASSTMQRKKTRRNALSSFEMHWGIVEKLSCIQFKIVLYPPG